jgi:hypothetical protein
MFKKLVDLSSTCDSSQKIAAVFFEISAALANGVRDAQSESTKTDIAAI